MKNPLPNKLGITIVISDIGKKTKKYREDKKKEPKTSTE